MTPHHQQDFDTIVITAANEAQAQSYETQLSARQAEGLLGSTTEYFVIADPGGRRVGSGTSTIAVLAQLLANHQKKKGQDHSPVGFLKHQRILIAHSGGDARRLLPYAAHGKIFMPLPCDVTPMRGDSWQRFPATLFDLLLNRLTQLPYPNEGQILICSGDVLLTFDASRAEVSTTDGFCGLGFAAAPTVGRQHGVYITPNPSVGGPVTGFLQKPTLEQLIEHDALDLTGRVLVDSGVFCLAPSAALALLKAAGVNYSESNINIGPGLYEDILNGKVGIVDLYQEIALALPRTATREQYLQNISRSNQSEAAQRSLGRFFDTMHEAALAFEVAAVPDGEFFHIGTSRDLLTKFTQPSRTARSGKFHNGWRTPSDFHTLLRQAEKEYGSQPVLFNVKGAIEYIDPRGPVYLENCAFDSLSAPLTLDGNNIIVGWPESYGSTITHLPSGIGLIFLPVTPTQNQTTLAGDSKGTETGIVPNILHVPVLFGVDDDNKTTLETGQCHFLNQNIQQLIDAGMPPEVLWPDGGERSSWSARLWLINGAADAFPLLLTATGVTGETPTNRTQAVNELMNLWQGRERLSWADLIKRTDDRSMLDARRRIATHFDCEHIFNDLLSHPDFPANEAVKKLAEFTDLRAAQNLIQKIQTWNEQIEMRRQEVKRQDTQTPVSFVESLTQARIWSAAALVAEFIEKHDTSTKNTAINASKPSHLYKGIALHSVARAVESTVTLAHEPRPAAIQEDQVVWATAPARIDFAGGWSDTPPICFERGGAVLNAAVTINRQYPIQIVAKLNTEKCIRLTSIDLGKQEIYHEAADINGTPNLGHWSSLAKAALVLSGIVPDAHYKGQQSQTLSQWLDVLGGGLDLTLFSGLPKGSGMGTSSIMGAATLACLAGVQGHELTHAELISQTSLLEQRMTSGGGWQDQIGGIVAGVKLIRTEPGVAQTPALQWSVFGAPGYTERFGTGMDNATDLLSRRMLLYFTGQKRLAKNILQNVVGRYLNRERELLQIIDRLKQGAHDAKFALEANDIIAFAHHVSEYWELKKAVDPGSTNAEVEAILERVHPLTSGYSLCGAGGGGFMLLIARDEQAADAIRRELQDNPPNAHARFFHFAIDTQGLAITTL